MPKTFRLIFFYLAWCCAASACIARAQPPAPLNPELFSFAGSVTGPGSATSAGLALADRWLGDEPFGNPAIGSLHGLSLSPAILRVSRQDLRADNRRFDEQAAFFDAVGGWLVLPGLPVTLYGYQPVVRLEDNAFERGEFGAPTPPAVIQSRATTRELRAGVAISGGVGPVRLGAAGEWTRREDEYFVREQSGSPEQGERRVEFSGDGFGFQAGARVELGPSGAGALALGAGARYVPAITLEGEQHLTSLIQDSTGTVSGERESGWEGGLSARYALTESFRLVAGLGGRTAQEWRGFGVTSGAGGMWSLAGVYHDSRDPWTLRFGFGEEHQSGVPEPRAGIVGLGFGWELGESRLDVGVVRRSFARASDRPTSFDDRVVGSITLEF